MDKLQVVAVISMIIACILFYPVLLFRNDKDDYRQRKFIILSLSLMIVIVIAFVALLAHMILTKSWPFN